jgi:hypothetical protein
MRETPQMSVFQQPAIVQFCISVTIHVTQKSEKGAIFFFD